MTAKPEPLFHCILCGRSGFVKKAEHKVPPGGSKAAKCPGAFEQISATPCWTCHFQANKACPDPIVISACPWAGCDAWIAKPSVATVALVAPPAPPLLNGDDQAVAANFKTRFAQAEDAKFRVAAFGIYAHYIKLKLLKHGQFYDWVEATLGVEHRRTVQDHMLFAKSTLERIGYPSLKSFFSNPQTLRICHSGEFLLLPDAEVPAEAKPIREKVCSLFAGKSRYQLFSEWKQVEDDGSGNTKVKVGRIKGQGGATKHQRAAKAAADAAAEKASLETHAKDLCKWLKANCADDKIGSKLTDATLQSLNDWSKVAYDYTSGILSARQKAPATT